MTNSPWDLVLRGTPLATIPAENEAFRLRTLQTTHRHSSVLNMALSLEPASKIPRVNPDKEATWGRGGKFTWCIRNSPWRLGHQWEELTQPSQIYFLKGLISATVSTRFTVGTPELGAGAVGKKLIMDSFLSHSLLLLWAVLDLDRLQWPEEVTGLGKRHHLQPRPTPGFLPPATYNTSKAKRTRSRKSGKITGSDHSGDKSHRSGFNSPPLSSSTPADPEGKGLAGEINKCVF